MREIKSPVVWTIIAVLLALAIVLVIFIIGQGVSQRGGGADEPSPALFSTTIEDHG
jgi:hypothetical protein